MRIKGQISLFDVVDREAEKEKAAIGQCSHLFEIKTERDWPDHPGDLRMVFICETCGRIRGRIKG